MLFLSKSARDEAVREGLVLSDQIRTYNDLCTKIMGSHLSCSVVLF